MFIYILAFCSIMLLRVKDKAILHFLNENARMPDAVIAKKLQMSKQAVGYNIRKLEKQKLIKGFYTEYNISKLGYNSFYIFLHLVNITNIDEQQLLKRIISEENVGWVVSGIGQPNLILLTYAKTLHEFGILLCRIKQHCSSHLSAVNFAILTESQKFSYRFLQPSSSSVQREKIQPILLDDLDKKLLITLANTPRERIVNLALKIHQSTSIVKYRLRKLERTVIQGFRLKLDIAKLGLQWYLLLITLESCNEEKVKKLIAYLTEREQTYYVTSIVGSYDLMADVHVRTTEEMHVFISSLREICSINHFDLFLISKEHKYSYLPKLI